jgi:hypothetical protein
MSTASAGVLGASLVAAALALGLAWPRPAAQPAGPGAAAPPAPAAGAGRYRLYHVPVYYAPGQGQLTPDYIGKRRGVTVYVLDTRTGRLLSESEAKAVKAAE